LYLFIDKVSINSYIFVFKNAYRWFGGDDMKHALTVKQSLLFTDLSMLGNSRKYFKKALGIDYELNEVSYCNRAVSWNYDSDIEYNRALLKNRDLNQAIEHFIISLSTTTTKLEQITEAISGSLDWILTDDKQIKHAFGNYSHIYLQNMPFLFMFWNTENLLFNQLSLDFRTLFGEEKPDSLIQKTLIPAKHTQFSLERRNIEKIAVHVNQNHKLKSLTINNDARTVRKKLSEHTKLKSLLDNHIKQYAFTTTSFHLNNPQSLDDLIKKIKGMLEKNIDSRIREGLSDVFATSFCVFLY